MSFKIENVHYVVNEKENSITLGWMETQYGIGIGQFQAETFDWYPNNFFFRLFVAKDPAAFTRKTVAKKEYEMQRKPFCFYFNQKVESAFSRVKESVKRNVNALVSKIRKAVKNFFRKSPSVDQPKPLFPKAPATYAEKVKRKIALLNPDREDRGIPCFFSDEWEPYELDFSSSANGTSLFWRVKSCKEQIDTQIRRNIAILKQIAAASGSHQDFSKYALFQADKNAEFLNNKISDPQEFLDRLQEIRNELDLLMRKRPKELNEDLASLRPEWKASLEALNNLIGALEN